jgi:Pentapeptide repeats (8 copies)
MPDPSPLQSSQFTNSESVEITEAHPSLKDQTQLVERVQQGDINALQQYLDLKLAPYQARIEDIGLRKEQLQISLSGPEVPQQEILEPLMQTWVVQLGLFKFPMIELYGQRDGSALPFWRCSFNPKDVDLDSLKLIPPPEMAAPVGFVDPLQVEMKGGPVDQLPEDPWETPVLEITSTHPLSEVSAPLSSVDAENKQAVGSEGKEEAVSPSAPQTEAASQEKTKAVKDFLARYAAGERDFAKINLNEADLSRVNLTLANLHEAELIWANLTEANLYHIDLSLAKLRQANLSGAMLRSSNLQGTDFVNANLRGADLSWSNLNGANLTGADLTDANLKNAILERVILPDGTLLD